MARDIPLDDRDLLIMQVKQRNTGLENLRSSIEGISETPRNQDKKSILKPNNIEIRMKNRLFDYGKQFDGAPHPISEIRGDDFSVLIGNDFDTSQNISRTIVNFNGANQETTQVYNSPMTPIQNVNIQPNPKKGNDNHTPRMGFLATCTQGLP